MFVLVDIFGWRSYVFSSILPLWHNSSDPLTPTSTAIPNSWLVSFHSEFPLLLSTALHTRYTVCVRQVAIKLLQSITFNSLTPTNGTNQPGTSNRLFITRRGKFSISTTWQFTYSNLKEIVWNTCTFVLLTKRENICRQTLQFTNILFAQYLRGKLCLFLMLTHF